MINNGKFIIVSANMQVIDFNQCLLRLGDFAPILVLLLEIFLRGVIRAHVGQRAAGRESGTRCAER
jgi:hypothetical protein